MRAATAVPGLFVALAGAGWTAISADSNPGSRPWPVLAAIAVVSSAAIAGAVVARLGAVVAAGAVVSAAGVIAVLALPAGDTPDGGPFGYANATGAVVALGSLAAASMAATRWWPPGRVVAGGASAGLAAVVAVSGSAAAAALLPGAAVLLALTWRSSRRAAAAGGVAAALVLAGTLALAAGTEQREPEGNIGTRLALWNGALETATDNVATGVGPGRFEVVNPVSDDRDIRFAHHGLLQQAAEQGAVGAALLLAAFVIGFLRSAGSAPPAGPLAAASLAVLVIHSSVDHVLRYPAITAMVAFVVGAAVPARHHPSPRRSATSR